MTRGNLAARIDRLCLLNYMRTPLTYYYLESSERAAYMESAATELLPLEAVPH